MCLVGRVRRLSEIQGKSLLLPMERIDVDIIDPLARTKSGNKYLLALLDYGTWYPKTMPLRSTHAA